MNGPGEKTFKQLWRLLSGEGWKARKPTGLSVDFTYLKPGVKGGLNKSQRGEEFVIGEEDLMAFRRRAGLLGLPEAPPASRPFPELCESSERPESAPEPTVLEPVPAESSERPGEVVRGPTQDDTEQGQDNSVAITSDTDHDVRVQVSDAEESTTETADDDHARRLVPVDAFDGEYFLGAMRDENLFDGADVDDVNILKTPDDSAAESEADEDDYGADASDDEGVIDIESSDEEDVDSNMGMTDGELRAITGSGWVTYDEHHVGDLQVDAADDYYDGPCGPT